MNYNKANAAFLHSVLNLIINGLPSIYNKLSNFKGSDVYAVLNLIINGLPSILCYTLIQIMAFLLLF